MDFDVVIVGAGAAGIATAHRLLSQGYKIAIVEAADRIGGRVWTDTSTYSMPCDVGAHWLHYGLNNFYLEYGKGNGFDIYPDARNFKVYSENSLVKDGREQIVEAMELIEQAIEESALPGVDISLAEATDAIDHPMFPAASYILGPWLMAKELKHLSVPDYMSSNESFDWFCREGFGTLVAHYGAALPVSLNTAVVEIDWSGRDLKVKTTDGTIRSRVVVLTVSTGVLASGAISFKPHLPAQKQESFDCISMGHYEHIWLEFSEPIGLAEPDTYVTNLGNGSDTLFSAFTNAAGSGLTYFDVGGEIALELTQLEQTERVNFALDKLRSVFGSEIDRKFIKGSASSWANDPLTRGSYATAKPGCFHMREVLRETIADRIFFAGEACHPNRYASVAGAHQSADEVADQIILKFG